MINKNKDRNLGKIRVSLESGKFIIAVTKDNSEPGVQEALKKIESLESFLNSKGVRHEKYLRKKAGHPFQKTVDAVLIKLEDLKAPIDRQLFNQLGFASVQSVFDALTPQAQAIRYSNLM